MECSESAFLREGALFVYFCKTGSLLGYENDGQYSNFGYKDKKFNTGKSKAALINKQNNAKFARMPFVFTMYRMGVKKHMAKNFPPEGWKTEWVAVTEKKYTLIFIHACITIFALRRVARNYAEYIAKTTTSLFRGLCRRSVLKEWERSAKAQSVAISILSKDRGRTMRTKRFVCFFIKHRKTVDRIK